MFHYLGPSFAVLLFARVPVLGVAWLRIASAALVFALWRRPWRAVGGLDRATRRLLIGWGAVLAAMNCCFYEAIARLPLGTVAAIEFLPVIVLAAVGVRTPRNALALALAVAGVYELSHVQLAAQPLGFAFAFANAALFATYIVLAHRVARDPAVSGIDGLGAAMLIAAVAVTPVAAPQAAQAFSDPVAIAAGIGVGICSSVIPYVTDQLAMAKLSRAAYSLMVSLLPAVATVIGDRRAHATSDRRGARGGRVGGRWCRRAPRRGRGRNSSTNSRAQGVWSRNPRKMEREGMSKTVPVRLQVNGVEHAIDVEPRLLLVHAIRENLGLTGTHVGCDTSNCGACTVHLDGRAVKSCTVLAVQADGSSVTTIEGMGTEDDLHPLQEAFWNDHGLQCGYCTPGMIMAAAGLLADNPNPTEAEVRKGLEGNLCRCTGYHNIIKSVLDAAKSKGATVSGQSGVTA